MLISIQMHGLNQHSGKVEDVIYITKHQSYSREKWEEMNSTIAPQFYDVSKIDLFSSRILLPKIGPKSTLQMKSVYIYISKNKFTGVEVLYLGLGIWQAQSAQVVLFSQVANLQQKTV